MKKERTSFIFLILGFSIVLALFNFIATKIYLYWTVSWVDSVSHFLGGMIISLIWWQIFLKNKKEIIMTAPRFWTLAVALFVGIIWEILELVFHRTALFSSIYIPDTSKDIFFDIIGAFTAYYYFIKPVYDRE